jgi:hypothetical protein
MNLFYKCMVIFGNRYEILELSLKFAIALAENSDLSLNQ